MKDNLLRFDFNQKYIVCDVETEGLNLLRSRPWELAWTEAVGKKIVAKHQRFIWWPDLKVSDEAARITGFNYEKYRSLAVKPEDVIEEFWPIISNEENKIIGQNILGFDVYMLNSLRKNIGQSSDFNYISRVLDTKALAMAITKGIKTIDSDDLITWQYRWLNYREKGIKTSQAHLLKHYNIPHDPSQLHIGVYDVEMTFNIFQKQIYDIEI